VISMKHIYVSPHSDDVALSCGGTILSNDARSEDTLILNIFTSEPPIGTGADQSRRFVDAIDARRTEEDKLAWNSAGVSAEYLNFPEALIRRAFPFSILPYREDSSLASGLYEAVASYARAHPEAAFYFPAGFGGHVDHVTCQRVAMRLLAEGLVGRIFLYEDAPYAWLKFIRDRHYRALLQDMELQPGSLHVAFRPDGLGWREYLRSSVVPFPRGKRLFGLIALSLSVQNALGRSRSTKPLRQLRLHERKSDAETLLEKCRIIRSYTSQLPMLFGPDPDHAMELYRDLLSTEILIEIS
jgi:LmbE family N-acetylglucosaminyl deacetylase